MMTTQEWITNFELFYHLSLILMIIVVTVDPSFIFAAMIALIVISLIREVLNRTIGKNSTTIFDYKIFKFLEAALLILLMFVIYLSFGEALSFELLVTIGTAALSFLLPLFKRDSPEE